MLESVLDAEHMGRSGFDFLVVDSQHGEASPSGLMPLFLAAGAAGTPVFSRVISADPSVIMRSLDLGADGVIVPMINTAAETRAAAEACRYAPAGSRSFGPLRPGAGPVEHANGRTVFIPMIETLEALENLEEIASVPGVDALFVGPFDLGLLLGVSPADVPTSAAVLDAVSRIVDTASRRGIPVGSLASGEDHARAMVDRGIRFLSLGSDLTFIQQGAASRRELAGRLRGTSPVLTGELSA